MNDIMKEINTAYGLLASIPVRGDAVDAAAACRMALRKAYKLAEARSAREQGNSELRRPENRPGEAWRHFRRSSEQLPVAEGAERDKSGFGGERRSKGAERCLPAGQEEQSGVCEDESGEDEA